MLFCEKLACTLGTLGFKWWWWWWGVLVSFLRMGQENAWMLACLSGSGLWEVRNVMGPDPVRLSERLMTPSQDESGCSWSLALWRLGSILHCQEAASFQNPSALVAMIVKRLTYNLAMGSGNVCPTKQLMSWSDILNSYFCDIFERCYATCQIKGETEGKEANSCCGGKMDLFAVGRF